MGNWRGNGATDTLKWRKIGGNEEVGTFYQIVLTDANKQKLWTSPDTMDVDDPMAFGEWHFGISMPSASFDLDGNGRDVWMAPAPQSDVSPTFFRVFRWTGSTFRQDFVKSLSGDAKQGGKFSWTSNPSEKQWWIQSWGKRESGGIWATAVRYSASDVQEAKIFLTPTGKPDSPLSVAKSSLAQTTSPQSKTSSTKRSYRAKLSANDHRNSSGEPLKTVNDILRQDRANFYKYGLRDKADEADPWFASAENRTLFSKCDAVVVGDFQEKNKILHGTPTVEVVFENDTFFVKVLSE